MIFKEKRAVSPHIRFYAEAAGGGTHKTDVELDGPTPVLLDMAAGLAAIIISQLPQDHHGDACMFFGQAVTNALEQLKQNPAELLK